MKKRQESYPTGHELLAGFEAELAVTGQVSTDRHAVVTDRITTLETELHALRTVQVKIDAAKKAA